MLRLERPVDMMRCQIDHRCGQCWRSTRSTSGAIKMTAMPRRMLFPPPNEEDMRREHQKQLERKEEVMKKALVKHWPIKAEGAAAASSSSSVLSPPAVTDEAYSSEVKMKKEKEKEKKYKLIRAPWKSGWVLVTDSENEDEGKKESEVPSEAGSPFRRWKPLHLKKGPELETFITAEGAIATKDVSGSVLLSVSTSTSTITCPSLPSLLPSVPNLLPPEPEYEEMKDVSDKINIDEEPIVTFADLAIPRVVEPEG